MSVVKQFVGAVLGGMKAVVPRQIKLRAKEWYRERLFQHSMSEFISDPNACVSANRQIIQRLICGWGNEGWSASPEYMIACLDLVRTNNGPILECGSGLSTLLVGAMAKARGIEYWALEHNAEWAARVGTALRKYGIDNVRLCTAPLVDCGEFCWYKAPIELMPATFSLVICDGPPAQTKGGRYGLVPVLKEKLQSDCIILLDDASRPEEAAIAQVWAKELNASLEHCGVDRFYAKLVVSGQDHGVPTVDLG